MKAMYKVQDGEYFSFDMTNAMIRIIGATIAIIRTS